MIKGITFTLIALVLIYSSIHIMTPKYPPINKDLSLKELNEQIKEVIKYEIRNQRMQAGMDSSNRGSLIPANYIKASTIFANKLDICKNDKSCIVETYDEFMSENVSSITRKTTRSLYMIAKFGTVGELLNGYLSDLY